MRRPRERERIDDGVDHHGAAPVGEGLRQDRPARPASMSASRTSRTWTRATPPDALRTELAGGRVLSLKRFMREVFDEVRKWRAEKAAIPEQYPLLRTLQFAAQYWPIGAH
jgi:hypothetical protein